MAFKAGAWNLKVQAASIELGKFRLRAIFIRLRKNQEAYKGTRCVPHSFRMPALAASLRLNRLGPFITLLPLRPALLIALEGHMEVETELPIFRCNFGNAPASHAPPSCQPSPPSPSQEGPLFGEGIPCLGLHVGRATRRPFSIDAQSGKLFL